MCLCFFDELFEYVLKWFMLKVEVGLCWGGCLDNVGYGCDWFVWLGGGSCE